MGGSITGTQESLFAVHSRTDVAVTLTTAVGSVQLLGFTDEDDCIQLRPTDDTLSYTKGLYGGVSANVDTSKLGEIIFKMKSSHLDNGRIAQWHALLKAGVPSPGSIIVSSTNFRHTAFNCLPQKAGEVQPGSREDPSVEWTILAAEIVLWIPIASDIGTFANFSFSPGL